MIKQTLFAGAFALAAVAGTSSHAAVIDIGLIMDESGSVGSTNYQKAMDSLAAALTAAIPTSGANQYRIGVVSFGASAATVVAPTVINNAADLGAVTALIIAEGASGYGDPSGITNTTNFNAGFDRLVADFNAAGGTNDTAIVNMMTDGQQNGPAANTAGLKAAGWDALSFEAIGSGVNSTSLCALAYGSGGDGCTYQGSDPTQIGNPITDPFVIGLTDFDAVYQAAVTAKLQKIVIITNPIPVPASLPLIASGLALFGFLGRRRRKAA
jgi:hypothetical protein